MLNVKLKRNFKSPRLKELLIRDIEETIIENGGAIDEKGDFEVKFRPEFTIWNWKLFATIGRGSFFWNEKQLFIKFNVYKILLISFLLSSFVFITADNFLLGLAAFILFGVLNCIISTIRCYILLTELTE